MLEDGQDQLKTQTEMAAELGVASSTLSSWNKKLDWSAIKNKRREKYSRRMVKVDDAMFKAAEKGDVAAAKFLAERFDRWTPTSAVLTEHSLDEGIIDEELKALMDRRIDTAHAINQSQPVDEQGRGPSAPPADGKGAAQAG